MDVESSLKNILFLENEHSFRTVFAEVLRNHGFTVLEAADMAEAVQRCDEYVAPIDLSIIAALYGISAAEQLLERYPGMRVLYIGDAERKPHLMRLRQRPAWLGKPFTSEALLEAVRSLTDAG